jgi:signal transduction histidine kinase
MLNIPPLHNPQTHQALRATLLLRTLAVAAAFMTMPVRESLPPGMTAGYAWIAPPLLGLNLTAIVYAKSLAVYLKRRPAWLAIDLLLAGGIILIGGGWRSSYFEYTLTTIIVCTILQQKKGAYASALVLALVSLLKNPLPQGDPIEIFQAGNWDMRLGATLFYVTAGLILGYFSTIVQRLNELSEERVVAARQHSAIRQKIDLAFDLHDRLKSRLSAIMLVAGALAKRQDHMESTSAKEIRRLWQWLNHFQMELNELVLSLKANEPDRPSGEDDIDLGLIAREEIRIFSEMTGFACALTSVEPGILIPKEMRPTLCAFISEALTNAWKHSERDRCTIRLSQDNGRVRLSVIDEGKGFDTSVAPSAGTSGLASMMRRSEALNGQLDIASSPDKGCCCTLCFAVSPAGLKPTVRATRNGSEGLDTACGQK